jgi:parallel beta-helix repeat protein
MKNVPTFAIAVFAIGALFWIVQAGDMEPPGPPAPTMKTLVDVEPRIAVYCAELPLEVSQPGSYYLAEDCGASGGGITVSSSHVTIDLNGYRPGGQITSSGSEGDYIEIRNGVTSKIYLPGSDYVRILNVTVKEASGKGIWLGDHGLIRDTVVDSATDIGMLLGSHTVVQNTQSFGNGEEGMKAGDHTHVIGCAFRDNIGWGMSAGSGSIVEHTRSFSNYNAGILAGSSSLVKDCEAIGNGHDAFNGEGIVTGAYSRVSGCVSRDNMGIGIYVGQGSTVEYSSSIANLDHGIIVYGRSYVLNNNVYGNAAGSPIGAGIHASSTDNRIEGNNLIGNDVGIEVLAAGNVIIKNSASGNSTNYVIVGGNDVGPVGSAATATSPWANIAF